MKNKEFEAIKVSETPKLIMRYYKTDVKLKGNIVFVHGVSHGAWCWKNFVNYFTKLGYACFVINLRGHGDNDKKDIKRATLSDYVDDTKKCIDYCIEYCSKIGIKDKPYIVGHSMGGAIVELYIGQYADIVKGAVLFAPATAEGMGWKKILTTSFSLRGMRTSFTSILGLNIFLAKSNFFAIKNRIKCYSRISKEDLEYSKQSLCKESIKAMFGLRKFNLKKPNIPVFVIGSDKDAYFPADSLNKTANFYDTKPMILEGLCHDMMLDENGWEESAKYVLNFIEDNK